MATTSKSAIPVVFGAMTFGAKGTEATRVHTSEEQGAILELFQSHGHSDVDTARIYGNGTSEEHLGALSPSWQSRGLVMDTKLYPYPSGMSSEANDHSAGGIRLGLERSLAALKAERVHTFYLHAPDAQTPFEETLDALDALHREGRFERLGISNFQAWQVARMCELSIAHGWIRPTVYQGQYNALQRIVEAELFQCLRQYGIAFYAFAPLAGGMLTGRYTRGQEDFEEGSRFDPKKIVGQSYRMRYLNEQYYDALDILKAAVDGHGLTLAETALRWINHHSYLQSDKGDKIIIGASRKEQLEQNLIDLEKGPLPQDVVDAMEAGWAIIRGTWPQYWIDNSGFKKSIRT